MAFKIKEKFNAFVNKHVPKKADLKAKYDAFIYNYIARDYTLEDTARDFAREIQRLYFNLHTQDTRYTREEVTAAVYMLNFSKMRYGVDPLLSGYKDVEPVIKHMIDSGDIYEVLDVAHVQEAVKAEESTNDEESLTELRAQALFFANNHAKLQNDKF